MPRIKSGATITTLSLKNVEKNYRRAELRLAGLKPPLESFEGRVYIDEPNANAQTATRGNPHYLGSEYFYGLGVADILSDDKGLYRMHRTSQSALTEMRLNITSSLRAYLAENRQHDAPIILVAVDRRGQEIAEPDLEFESASVVFL
jgi:hypothetical protein